MSRRKSQSWRKTCNRSELREETQISLRVDVAPPICDCGRMTRYSETARRAGLPAEMATDISE